MRVDEPTVAEACRAPDRTVVVGREPDRRVGLLDGPAGHCDVAELADVVLEADGILGPQAFDDFQTLLEAAHALATRHAERIELDIAIAEPDTEDKIAAPDRIERGDVLSDFDRIVQGCQQHPGDAGHLARLGGEASQERNQLDLPHPIAEVMLAGRHRVPPAVAGQPCHGILALQRGDHVASWRVLAGKKDPDLHDVSVVDGLPDLPTS